MAQTDEVHWKRFRGYLVTGVAVLLAAALIRLLQAIGYQGLSPLFAALIVSAWYGGVGPAVLGILLTTLAAYFLLPHASGGQMYREDFLRAAVFTLTAMVGVAVHLAARRAEESARRGRRVAEQASEAKTRLLAMVSHDLKNPLNPILMALAVAEQDPLVAERARASLDLIRSSITVQSRLIEDLLDVARLASGKFHIFPAPVDVHDLLEKTLFGFRKELEQKRLNLTSDFKATTARVNGDAARLQQLFWNLLSNAVKFTPAGGSIAVRTYDATYDARAYDAAAGRVAVEVRDSGVGIEPDTLPLIFNVFEQGGEAVTSRFGGLGLGLAICRGIVDTHGGTITASSIGVGLGTTMTVRLPVRPESEQPAPRLRTSGRLQAE